MRIRSIEKLIDSDDSANSFVVMRQQFSHKGRHLRGLALLISGGLLAAPCALVLATEGGYAQFMTIALAQPIVALKLAMVVVLALLALGFGGAQFMKPSIKQRVIKLSDDVAAVEETIGGRLCEWQEPMGSFRGLRHKVVTTSEGAMHTLVMEHQHRKRSLHLACERHIGDQAIMDASQRYDLPILNHASPSHDRSAWLPTLPAMMSSIERPGPHVAGV